MVPASLPLAELPSSDVTRDLMQRVKAIEDHLGLTSVPKPANQGPKAGDIAEPWYDDEPLDKLWEASAVLERCVPNSREGLHWRRSHVRHLWNT
jgi:hypothetical protein